MYRFAKIDRTEKLLKQGLCIKDQEYLLENISYTFLFVLHKPSVIFHLEFNFLKAGKHEIFTLGEFVRVNCVV